MVPVDIGIPQVFADQAVCDATLAQILCDAPRPLALLTAGADKGLTETAITLQVTGRQFVELGCNTCHSVAGHVEHAPLEQGALHVELGGTVSRVKTYADLVTSIINPSHKLSRGTNSMTMTESGESRMPIYNEVMTVQQLVDLTAFLETTYEVWVPPYNVYQYP